MKFFDDKRTLSAGCAVLFFLLTAQAQAYDPNLCHQLTRQARQFLRDGDPARAVPLLTEAIKLDPTQSEAHVKMADALFMLQKFEQSITECNTALKLHPNQHRLMDIIYRRGCSNLGNKNPTSALQDLNKVIAEDPERNNTYRARAEVYRLSGNNKAAIADYQKYLSKATAKDDIPAVELVCAQCYRECGDRAHERVELTKVLALVGESIDALRLRGDSFYKDSKFAEAASDYKKAIAIEPENEHCRSMLKKALARVAK